MDKSLDMAVSGERRVGWLFAPLVAAALALASVRADDAAPAENLLARQLQRAYYYLYEGNKLDREAHEKLAAHYRQEAEARKRAAAESEAKKKAYEDRLELARLYTELSQHNATIAKAFEQTVDEAETLAAMEAVPRLEQRIARLTGQQPEREWLTFDEVQARSDSGMAFKTEAPDILPYAVHHWYWPDKANDGKQEKQKIKPPRQEPPK